MSDAILEIERKFLVCGDYKSHAKSCVRLSQGYICSDRDSTVRVRITDDRAFITIKGPSSETGLSRFEWEKEISVEDARMLMSLCNGTIDKTRYFVEAGDHVFDVDEFHDDNEGLIVAEIELASEDEVFERPSWLGEEVTGDVRYYNSMLLRNPYKDWE